MSHSLHGWFPVSEHLLLPAAAVWLPLGRRHARPQLPAAPSGPWCGLTHSRSSSKFGGNESMPNELPEQAICFSEIISGRILTRFKDVE